MKTKYLVFLLTSLFLGVMANTAPGGTISGSEHDLSVSGQPPCVYCHIPSPPPDGTYPLWDKSAKDLKGYETYGSGKTSPPQPRPWYILPPP